MKAGCLIVLAACVDAPNPKDAIVTCGDAPYADVEIAAVERDGSPATSFAEVWFSDCRPIGVDAMRTDDTGHLHARVSSASPHSILIGQTAVYAPTVHPEQTISDGPLELPVVRWDDASATPGYCVDEGNLEVRIEGDCGVDGATVEVVGRTDLSPLYLDSPTTFSTDAAATTAYGIAMFGRLPTPDPVEVIVRKPGCVASIEGRVPTEPGGISTIVATLVTP